MKIFVKFAILALSIYIAAYIIPGVTISSVSTLLVVSIVLGLINTFIKPILVILTFPLTIVTLGIFLLILNGLLVLLVGNIVPGFHIGNLFVAILFSIVVSVISSLLSRLS
jgi:putative membrane protein